MFVNRPERGDVREDARAAVSDQQMRSVNTRYPVDRYLVESSKKFEMVNITDDDLWNTEPALRPEDEIILRKLHEMLQSTADDLKLLSGELSKFHEPGVQVKTVPTPLDEEFNEKVHIEEIVNAKFHGYKIIDKSPSCVPEYKQRNDARIDVKPTVNLKQPLLNNTNVQVNTALILKKPINRNLGITRTKVIQVNGNQDSTKTEKLNNGKVVNAPAVAYNEYSYKYVEPKLNTPRKVLQVQEMPSINIRGELKEQKVLQLDIIPEAKESVKSDAISRNVVVVTVQHEVPEPSPITITTESHKKIQQHQTTKPAVQPTVRKVSKMSTCDSSGSTNNISSDTQIKLKTQKRLLTSIRSPKNVNRFDRKKANIKKESDKRSPSNLDEWRKKLNVVYGPSNTKTIKPSKQKSKTKVSPKKTNLPQKTSTKPSTLNNAEYIPYSKLTVGGVRASDIEREISEIPNKNNIPLSPILDKILSSRENSFSKNSPRKQKTSNSLKVLTTSDENLLQEVIDIERTVTETLSKNLKSAGSEPNPQKVSSDTDDAKANESYVDDFEDDKSDHSGQSPNQRTYSRHSNETNKTSDEEDNYSSNSGDNNPNEREVRSGPSTTNANIHNLTYTKISNLSFKNQIDVFEFVHAIDTQDSATQSNGKQKISPKETQTTPRSDNNVQPIHNDLWPSIDPNGRVEKMFELEKEFIKKFIVEEYGDIIEKNITKPSTSKEIENKKNVAASQKNTQTSPAHVKNVMTSPTRTKTRTTSPFTALTVDHHTSPLIFVTNEDDVKVDVEEEDLAISINLSSPRFSLRLPGNSREVISNMGDSLPRTERRSYTETKKSATEPRKSATEVTKTATEANRSNTEAIKLNNFNITSTSTSSVEADSSDISSLGEVKLKKLFARKTMISSDSASVCSSSSKYSSDLQSGILPLRSEGEMSLGLNKKSNKHSKSEGEASFDMF